MYKSILYPLAKTKTGEVIKAIDAERGETYYCITCNRAVRVVKGRKRQDHLQHKHSSQKFCGERAQESDRA